MKALVVCLVTLAQFTAAAWAQERDRGAPLPDLGESEKASKKADEIYPELVLIGLLNELPARNSVEVDDGLLAHFYESQDFQFQVARRLLGTLLESKGFKGDVRWREESNKGKSIYSPEGVQILNQYLEPFSTGQGILKNDIFVERVGNYFDFTPGQSMLTDEETPTRSTMLSLLAGFLLQGEADGQVHAKDTPFARKMLEFMLLEGCVFDSLRIHVATPQTIHLKLRPEGSISLALDYVSKQREAVGADQKGRHQE